MRGGSAKKIQYVGGGVGEKKYVGGGGVGEKIKMCEGDPRNFPFGPPLRILNGIALTIEMYRNCSILTLCLHILGHQASSH